MTDIQEMTPVTSNRLKNKPADMNSATAMTLAAIGERIREARLARDLTLQMLADTTKLSISMLSLVERGRASPSIGSLIVVASALGISMSDLMAGEPASEEGVVVRASQYRVLEAADVVRKLIREDRTRGVSIAINEYEPNTGSSDRPVSHTGFEYGFILDGTLTVDIDKTSYILEKGDLISYSSRRPHRIWNFGRRKVRALWVNLERD